MVDNASTDDTAGALRKEFGERIRLVESEENVFAGGGRNLGAQRATGEYLLFIDSDNEIASDMIEELLIGQNRCVDLKIGMCGPFIYYLNSPSLLCGTRWDINMTTSATWWEGVGEKDIGQYVDTPFVRVGHIPNVFMVPRVLFEQVGGIDADYVMHYEESDLAEKIKRSGFDIVLFPKAKTCHDIPREKPKGDKQFAGDNRCRLYYSVRNRILFMRKNSGGVRLVVFLALLAHVFLLYNLLMLLWNRRVDLIPLVFRAHVDGLRGQGGERCGQEVS